MTMHEGSPADGRGGGDALKSHYTRPEPGLLLRMLAVPALLLALVLILAEGFGRAAWRMKEGSPRLALYAESVRTARSHRFFDPPGLVLPIPGEDVAFRKASYTDIFRAKDVLGKGFGLFDDGLKQRPVRALALGDSFTRGDGSLDNLAQGWVSLVERKLPWLDFVNLGGEGGGAFQQARAYWKIAPLIQHDWVVLNFSSVDDFLDNADAFDWNVVLAGLPKGEDPSALYGDIREALIFNRADDFLLNAPVKSRALWAGLALGRRVFGPVFVPARIAGLRARYSRMQADAADPDVPDAVRLLARENRKHPRFVPRAEGRRFDALLFPYHRRPYEAQDLAWQSARLINAFHARLKAGRKRLLVVIHPAPWEVYLTRDQWNFLDADAELPKAMLKRVLDSDIPVLDLTGPMKKAAAETPEPLYWLDDDHYFPDGHAVVASAVSDFLAKNRVRP